MEASDPTASTLSYKGEARTPPACNTRTSFMISDILDSSRRSPRQRSADDCSEPEDDAASEDRDHAASTSDTESAPDCEADEQSKLLEDGRGEDICCGGSPKSSHADSPEGEGLSYNINHCVCPWSCDYIVVEMLEIVAVCFCSWWLVSLQALQWRQ